MSGLSPKDSTSGKGMVEWKPLGTGSHICLPIFPRPGASQSPFISPNSSLLLTSYCRGHNRAGSHLWAFTHWDSPAKQSHRWLLLLQDSATMLPPQGFFLSILLTQPWGCPPTSACLVVFRCPLHLHFLPCVFCWLGLYVHSQGVFCFQVLFTVFSLNHSRHTAVLSNIWGVSDLIDSLWINLLRMCSPEILYLIKE